MITEMDTSNFSVVRAPSFIVKLWDMVNNPDYSHIISWTESGESIVIKNKETLIFDLLPSYFKHNNLSSFIRQLNKYGFRKVHNIENHQEFEFACDNFLRDQPHLLSNIKRKQSESKTEMKISESDEALKDLLNKVQSLRKTQEVFESKVHSMEQEHQMLCKETNELKRKQHVQQKIVNNIMHFLANMLHQDDHDHVNIPVVFSDPQNSSSKNLMAITENPHVDQNVDGNSGMYNLLKVKNDPEIQVNPGAFSPGEDKLEEGACYADNQSPFVSFPIELVDDQENLQGSSNELGEVALVPDMALTSDETPLNIPGLDLGNLISLNSPGTSSAAAFGHTALGGIQLSPQARIPDQSPKTSHRKELGDHVNAMESNIKDLKQVLSDTNLNLDMKEVLGLFSPEELSVINEALES